MAVRTSSSGASRARPTSGGTAIRGGTATRWPTAPTGPWTVRLIEDRFRKYHDQVVGDIDGDGEPEILVASQRAGVITYYDIPDDPTESPWPRSCCHIVAEDMPDVEGLAVVDVDGDGQTEILAGPTILRPPGESGGLWTKEAFAPGHVMTRVGVADLDGDGKLEIVLSEGESHPGRLSICRLPDWEPEVLLDDLFHPHSLEIADFNGDGRPDIFVAEMGLGENPDPRMIILANQGGGRFEPVVFQRGIPTHEAKVGDLTGDGRPDIVGKPYHPERHIDVWFNETGNP